MDEIKYCKDATKLLKIHVVCGKDCPIFDKCPRLILEEATDKAIEESIKRMMEITGVLNETVRG